VSFRCTLVLDFGSHMPTQAPIPLPHAFYRQDAETVARALIGATLVRRFRRRSYRARIVETEAYVGPHDLACHAAKGRTRRTQTMYLPGGHAYVYFIYGMYDMLNVVTGLVDDPQAVLIRAAEPLDGWDADLSGPGKLTRALHITRAQDAVDLTGPALHFLARAPDDTPAITITPRIGVDYAGQWKDAPLRFFDARSCAVSNRNFPRAARRGGVPIIDQGC
jgi:DNA-3-methyladenine glycosylase